MRFWSRKDRALVSDSTAVPSTPGSVDRYTVKVTGGVVWVNFQVTWIDAWFVSSAAEATGAAGSVELVVPFTVDEVVVAEEEVLPPDTDVVLPGSTEVVEAAVVLVVVAPARVVEEPAHLDWTGQAERARTRGAEERLAEAEAAAATAIQKATEAQKLRSILSLKLAVMDLAASIVTVVAAALALATGPVQLLKTKPEFAVALTLTTVPES